MLSEIARLDRELLIFLNSLHHPLLDPVMTAASSREFWIPLYLAILGWLIYHFRRKCFLLVPLLLLAVTLGDQISSSFFKPYFARLRPCHEESLQGLVRYIKGCGGQFGFMSSHATNSFVLATFLLLLLGTKVRGYKWLFLLWAIVVSYSRIYLGVHYPADIVLGALLGIVLGWLAYRVYNHFEVRYFTR